MSKLIEEFVAINAKKEKAKRAIEERVRRYFKVLGISDIDNYFTSGRDIIKDFTDYANTLANLSPLTQKNYLNTVKVFFEDNGVYLSKKVMKTIRNNNGYKDARPVNTKETFDKVQMKIILEHANYKFRPFLLVLVSAGLRPGEALALRMHNFQIDEEKKMLKGRRIRVTSPAAKGGKQRYTFITNEAAAAINQWLQYDRKRFFLEAEQSPYYHGMLKEYNDDLTTFMNQNDYMFPFCYNTVKTMWVNILENLGHPYNSKDELTGQYTHTLHSIRRYFSNMFITLNDEQKKAKHYMIGQFSVMGVDADYFDANLNKLERIYNDLSYQVELVEDGTRVRKELEPLIREHQSTIVGLSQEQVRLREKTNELETLKQQMQSLMDLVYDEPTLIKRANENIRRQ
jgi:integrase